MGQRPPRPTRFPYTTLFRSQAAGRARRAVSALLPGVGRLADRAGLAFARTRALAIVLGSCGIATHGRSEEHTSELQSRPHLVCRLLLEIKNMALVWRRTPGV